MNKYIIAIIVLVQLFVSSCEDMLDINPKAEIVDEDMFSTAEGFEDALIGVYSNLDDNNLYGGYMMNEVPELLSQNFISSFFKDINKIEHTHPNVAPYYRSMWKDMYENISYLNNIIAHTDSEKSFKYSDLYRGEALGLRAFLHFDLLRFFAVHIDSDPEAKAIPYVTAYEIGITPYSTVSEAYEKIINDLKEAEELLAADETLLPFSRTGGANGYGTARETHFNLYAAQATLARVYWMKGDMENAGLYAKKLIDSGKFELADETEIATLVSGVLSFKETIWGVYSTDVNTNYNRYWNLASSSFLTYRTVEKYSPDDARKGWFRKNGYRDRMVKTTNMELIEFPNLYGRAEYQGINMIRIPEMYYILAESLLDTEPVLARELFDQVLESRGLVSFASQDKDLTLEDIFADRTKEFIGEGQEWFRMKRSVDDFFALYADGRWVVGSDAVYTLPIPVEEDEYRPVE